MKEVPVLIITGPVGVGKSTIAAAASELLDRRRVSHALVDADWLRWLYPRSATDPFETALGLENLAAVWNNYKAAGAKRLILVDVVESREALEACLSAIQGAEVTVVRLCASLQTIHSRLEGRETGQSQAWYRHRAVELSGLMQFNGIGDVLLDTEGRTVQELAAAMLDSVGWTSPG